MPLKSPNSKLNGDLIGWFHRIISWPILCSESSGDHDVSVV